MAGQVTVVRGPLGFLGAMTLLFIGLKLTGHIDWDWGWVLAPKLVDMALVLFGLLIQGVAAATKK